MKIKAKETVKKVAVAKTVKVAKASKMNVTKKAKTQRVTFTVRAKEGSKVFLAGIFNNWDPTTKPMADKTGDGVYTVALNLAPGSYQYKFVIDGTWCADPECKDWIQNDHGTLNSVKTVE